MRMNECAKRKECTRGERLRDARARDVRVGYITTGWTRTRPHIIVDQLVPRVFIAPGRSSHAANCTALSNCSTSGCAVVSMATSPRTIILAVGNCASGAFASLRP